MGQQDTHSVSHSACPLPLSIKALSSSTSAPHHTTLFSPFALSLAPPHPPSPQVLQLGTLAMIPYCGQLMLESGLVSMILTVAQQILTGSLMFYMFQQQTVATSFQNDMNYGAAKYVGTGRGFNISSMDFVKIYTLYARTHLYQGFELLFVLTTLYIVRDCGTCNYGLLTWSTWLVAFVFIFAPLWFNPFAFESKKVREGGGPGAPGRGEARGH